MPLLRLSPLIALPFLALAVGCASSPEPTGPLARMFEAMDTNDDGVVTEREVETLSDRRFARADGNADGFLDSAELAAAERDTRSGRGGKGRRAQRPPTTLAASDRDGDGRLDREEFAQRSLRAFDRMDRDADGRVTRREIAEMQERARARHGR